MKTLISLVAVAAVLAPAGLGVRRPLQAQRPVHRRGRHEQRPGLLRPSAGQVAQHRPAGGARRALRPRLLPVPAVQSRAARRC